MLIWHVLVQKQLKNLNASKVIFAAIKEKMPKSHRKSIAVSLGDAKQRAYAHEHQSL